MSSQESTPILADPRHVLLELAGMHRLDELLPLAVGRLAASPAVALVRVWLLRAPLAGDCGRCQLADECQNRQRCLHLVASSGQSLDASAPAWSRLDGDFRRFPIGVRKVGRIAKTGQSLEVPDVARDHDWAANPGWIDSERITSFVGHPLIYRSEVLGVVGLFARVNPTQAGFEWLRMIADHLAAAIGNSRAHEEIESLKNRLEEENEYLRSEVLESESYGELVGKSVKMHAVAQQIELVSPTDSSVLILGESGTGKEVVAREIHRRSRRAGKPFVKVNCAAIPRDLYESEFFGHARGAFTGALRDRMGRFELADGGTLFLDEVGEIPLDLQAKLLRVLQDGEVERVGCDQTRRLDVRVLAATNRRLREESEGGRFRQDLYFRLSVFPIELPPLRERTEDIALLADRFIDQISRRIGRQAVRLRNGDLAELERYRWPGNVRELQHVLERALICAVDGRLRIALPGGETRPVRAEAPPEARVYLESEVRAFEADNIRRALAEAGGKIYGPEGAAARLGLKATTLASRMRSFGIEK